MTPIPTKHNLPPAAGHAGHVPSAISVSGLTRVFEIPGRGDTWVRALDGVDADIAAGSFTAVVGASGSGKSTMLYCMAGLDQPTTGRVTLLGTPVTDLPPVERAAFRAREIGFIFQDYNLIASLTAVENVTLPSRLAGKPVRRADAVGALARVGLEHRADLKPHQLSGGERQRVAIARVMMSRPRIVFADEPTGALDLESSRTVLDWLAALADEGVTVVMVTHDVEAAARAGNVVVMSQGHLAGWTASRDPREIADLVHASRS